jgi:hypothetical protein
MKYASILAAVMFFTACPHESTCEQVQHAVYVDTAIGVSEVDGEWIGNGQSWSTEDIDGALLHLPLVNAVPHGATLTGYSIRWRCSGPGTATAVLYRYEFDGGNGSMIGDWLWMSTDGVAVVDTMSGLDEVVDESAGYEITVETSGAEQVCRVHQLLLHYEETQCH